MNDVRFTMTMSVISMLVVRVGLSYFLAPILGSGAYAVWWAMVADWLVRISSYVGRYLSGASHRLAFPNKGKEVLNES